MSVAQSGVSVAQSGVSVAQSGCVSSLEWVCQ